VSPGLRSRPLAPDVLVRRDSIMIASPPAGSTGHCSRNPDFAHPVLMIIRICLLIRGSYICRISTAIGLP
jgi:hypothetical protein